MGLCHGTRHGKEQEWFAKYLDCDVIGTDISLTASDYPNTIQWVFHEFRPEWIDAFDFIYSNSLDHSYDPGKCLTAWMQCVHKGGVCIIEHTSDDDHARRLDPFGAHLSIMPYFILEWGRGKFWVREILDAPTMHPHLRYCRFLVLQKQ